MPPIPRVAPRRDRLKRCAGPCADWLPVECFDLDRARADGRRSYCKGCRRDREAELEALINEWTKLKAVVQARAALPEGGNERAVLRELEET